MQHFRFGGPLLSFEVGLDVVERTNEAKFLGIPVLAFCFVDFIDGCGFGEFFSEEFGGGFLDGFEFFFDGFGGAAATAFIDAEVVESARERG